MRKLLFALPLMVLLAVGCNNSTKSATQTASLVNGQPNANQAPLACTNIISLDQIKTLVGDNNMILTNSGTGNANDPGIVCIFQNSDPSNPSDPNNPVILKKEGVVINLSVYNYNQAYNDSLKAGVQPTVDVSGLGSQAFSYSNGSSYTVVSSNKKYTINVGAVVADYGKMGSDFKVPVDYAKQTQDAQAIVKAVDFTLNKY